MAARAFVAVDFETANRASESACQIALVKVIDGQVVERLSTLLAPPEGLDWFSFTYLHGIGPRDVLGAPNWHQAAPYVAHFCQDLPMYAHNAPFDFGVWRSLDAYYGTATLPAGFYCSYRTARRLVPGLTNYKLPTVAAYLVPDFQLDHHRADSDAEACALIVAALQRLAG